MTEPLLYAPDLIGFRNLIEFVAVPRWNQIHVQVQHPRPETQPRGRGTLSVYVSYSRICAALITLLRSCYIVHKERAQPAQLLRTTTQSSSQHHPYARRVDHKATSRDPPEADRVFDELFAVSNVSQFPHPTIRRHCLTTHRRVYIQHTPLESQVLL